MTVNEYLKRERKYEPEFYTVNELYNALEELIVNGMGNHIVLIPNPYTDGNSDYVFTDKRASLTENDTECHCVYLNAADEEDDEYLARQIFGE